MMAPLLMLISLISKSLTCSLNIIRIGIVCVLTDVKSVINATPTAGATPSMLIVRVLLSFRGVLGVSPILPKSSIDILISEASAGSPPSLQWAEKSSSLKLYLSLKAVPLKRC